jgi:hypothetical protein
MLGSLSRLRAQMLWSLRRLRVQMLRSLRRLRSCWSFGRVVGVVDGRHSQ